jgi:Asp-tRNA(Asn)/Glu-tRNA(Gln) amidotransferase A subunit family amidase
MPLDFSLDHMGLTRSVRDAALTLEALAGMIRATKPPPASGGFYLPPASVSIPGLRIGWPEISIRRSIRPPSTAERMAEAAAGRRADPPVRVRTLRPSTPWGASSSFGDRVDGALSRSPRLADVPTLLGTGQVPFTELVTLGGDVWMRGYFPGRLVDRSAAVTQLAYTWPVAPKIGATTVKVGTEMEDVRLASTRLVRAINVLGLPAIAMPCGLDPEGMPLGAQIVGKPFDEATILRVAAAIEDATDYHQLRPQL